MLSGSLYECRHAIDSKMPRYQLGKRLRGSALFLAENTSFPSKGDKKEIQTTAGSAQGLADTTRMSLVQKQS